MHTQSFLMGLSMAGAFALGCAMAPLTVSPARAQHQKLSEPLKVPPAPAGVRVQRWDYFCFEEYRAKDIMPKAKAAGLEGWEMVAADGWGGGPSICFKRLLP